MSNTLTINLKPETVAHLYDFIANLRLIDVQKPEQITAARALLDELENLLRQASHVKAAEDEQKHQEAIMRGEIDA